MVKTVYRALDTELGCEVTWAEFPLCSLTVKEISQLSACIEKIQILKHKNLNNATAAWIKPDLDILVVIREFVTGGTLLEYINRFPNPQIRLIQMWSRGILNGLDYLHSQEPKIVHKRLTTQSIKLMSSDGTVKLRDYYFTHLIEKGIGIIDEPWYLAPETFDGQYSQKSDIYSFGIVLLEMYTQTTPYIECKGFKEMHNNIKKGILPRSISDVTDKTIQNIIKSCLSAPNDRPTAKDLLNTEFFKENIHETSAESLDRDENIKKISLVVLDSENRPRTVSFDYDEFSDTPEKVALEMIESLHMPKKSMKLVTNEIKKKLFDVNRNINTKLEKKSESDLPGIPMLKCSYSFENILTSNQESKLERFQKLLFKYYRLENVMRSGIDELTTMLVKKFQNEAGIVPNGKITDSLYRILKHRIVSS